MSIEDLAQLRALRDCTVRAVDALEYPTVLNFEWTAHAAVCGYLLGKGLRATRKTQDSLMDQISADAAGKNSETAKAWTKWQEKLGQRAKDIRKRSLTSDRSWLPPFLQRDGYTINDDFKIFVTADNQSLIFIGPNYRIVKTFADSSEVLELGLGLLDLYNIIGIETGKVTPSDLDQTLADEAIERMNHLFQFGVYDDNDQCDPNN